jgi:hypothetical protein
MRLERIEDKLDQRERDDQELRHELRDVAHAALLKAELALVATKGAAPGLFDATSAPTTRERDRLEHARHVTQCRCRCCWPDSLRYCCRDAALAASSRKERSG